jgi:hypothetical protein
MKVDNQINQEQSTVRDTIRRTEIGQPKTLRQHSIILMTECPYSLQLS